MEVLRLIRVKATGFTRDSDVGRPFAGDSRVLTLGLRVLRVHDRARYKDLADVKRFLRSFAAITQFERL